MIGNNSIYGGSLPVGQIGYERQEAELFSDMDQRDHPEKYRPHTAEEAATEVLDDFAGAYVGERMRDMIEGRMSADDLRKALFSKLCDH